MFPTRLFQLYCRLVRGKTLGARVVVIDAQQRVLLVKPGYVPGWSLPGGGVDKGETLRQAAVRELFEEAAVEPLEELQFHGIFANDRLFPGDHVGCFVLRKFKQGTFRPNHEISDAQFFALDALPPDTKPGSLARIQEVMKGVAISDHWA
jgi:ADP-ribose pyrophosphatase YjhB (NUDIX family)